MTPVLVEWLDAFADTQSWMEITEIDDEPCVVFSVGFLIADVKKGHVTIAQSRNSNEHVDSLLHVPVGMVKNVTLLN